MKVTKFQATLELVAFSLIVLLWWLLGYEGVVIGCGGFLFGVGTAHLLMFMDD